MKVIVASVFALVMGVNAQFGGGLPAFPQAPNFVAFTDFSSGASPLLGYQGAGGYGSGGYGAGGYGVGALANYNVGAYGALAVQSSSNAANVGAYDSYLLAAPNVGKHGPPALGFGGGKHGKHGKNVQVVQPYEDVEVQQFVVDDGQMVENEVNAYRRKKSYTVTHRPVYHKTVYNHYTAHDNVQKDVYHHIQEDEQRHYDVDGEDFYAGALNVDHGKVGYAAYATLDHGKHGKSAIGKHGGKNGGGQGLQGGYGGGVGGGYGAGGYGGGQIGGGFPVIGAGGPF